MIAAAKVAATIYITIGSLPPMVQHGFTTEAGCHQKGFPLIWDDQGRPVSVRVVCDQRRTEK